MMVVDIEMVMFLVLQLQILEDLVQDSNLLLVVMLVK